jgi:hypothetical protein
MKGNVMPQIFVMLSPFVQLSLGLRERDMLKYLDDAISPLVVSVWGVPEKDVAFSAMDLAYTRNEAHVQIEVRYTAGEDEYGTGTSFEPTKEKRGQLITEINWAVSESLREKYGFSCSAWTKPYKESTFSTL